MEVNSKKLNLKVPSPPLLQATTNDTPTPTRVLNSFIQKSKEVGLFDSTASVLTQEIEVTGDNPFAETFKRAITNQFDRPSPSATTNVLIPTSASSTTTTTTKNTTTNSHSNNDSDHLIALYDQGAPVRTSYEVTDLTLRPAVATVTPPTRQTDSSLSSSANFNLQHICAGENVVATSPLTLKQHADGAIYSGIISKQRTSVLPGVRLDTSGTIDGIDNHCRTSFTHNNNTYKDQQQPLSPIHQSNSNSRLSRFSENLIPIPLGSPSIFSPLQSPLILSPGTPLLQTRDLYKIINPNGHNLFSNSSTSNNRNGDSMTTLDSITSASCSISTLSSGPMGSPMQHQQQHSTDSNRNVSLTNLHVNPSGGPPDQIQRVSAPSHDPNVALGSLAQRFPDMTTTAPTNLDTNSNYNNYNRSQQYQHQNQQVISTASKQYDNHHHHHHQYHHSILSDAEYAQVIFQQQTALYNGLIQQYQQTNQHHLLHHPTASSATGQLHHDKAFSLSSNQTSPVASSPSMNSDCCRQIADTPANVALLRNSLPDDSTLTTSLISIGAPQTISATATTTNGKQSGQYSPPATASKMDDLMSTDVINVTSAASQQQQQRQQLSVISNGKSVNSFTNLSKSQLHTSPVLNGNTILTMNQHSDSLMSPITTTDNTMSSVFRPPVEHHPANLMSPLIPIHVMDQSGVIDNNKYLSPRKENSTLEMNVTNGSVHQHNRSNRKIEYQSDYSHARVLEILEHQQQQIEMLKQQQDKQDTNATGSRANQASTKQHHRTTGTVTRKERDDHHNDMIVAIDGNTKVNGAAVTPNQNDQCSMDKTVGAIFSDSSYTTAKSASSEKTVDNEICTISSSKSTHNKIDGANHFMNEGDALIIKARNATVTSVRQSKKNQASKSARLPSSARSADEPVTSESAANKIITNEPKLVKTKTKNIGGNDANKCKLTNGYKEESELKPRKRPSGRRRRHVTSEELQARKNRSKERNRVAARRCRQKRKVFMDELRKRTDHMDQLNQRLQKENMDLRREIEILRSQSN